MAAMEWGSDAVAYLLKELDFKYAALVPGASYRGLHDSIVNYLEQENLEMLLCLHEEHTVAIAHGYAEVTGVPMLAIVHSNVGLLHASMAIWNAWCSRVPVVVLGATGPLDAMKRRPWIDWIHSARDQAAIVRNFVKWDDQPSSPGAALESIVRAKQISMTAPCGPTYIVLDAGMQEQKLSQALDLPNLGRFAKPKLSSPSPSDVAQVVSIMRQAEHPVILVGRVARTIDAWNERVALAEALNARVITDPKVGSVFPTTHHLYAGTWGSGGAKDALAAADAVLNLDSIDLGGMLKAADALANSAVTIVSCSLDRYLHNGATMEYQMLAPSDLDIVVSPDRLVASVVASIGQRGAPSANGDTRIAPDQAPGPAPGQDRRISIDDFTEEFAAAFAGIDTCLTRIPMGVNPAKLAFEHPLDYLGHDGGGGVGSGPGIAVGAALALRGSGRMPVAGLGDGDFLMGVTALWTAVANEIPLLVVIANNGSYFNDELHQEKMAQVRSRPVERRWIGQRLDGPRPDLAGFARAQGAVGIGPIRSCAEIGPSLAHAIEEVRAGKVCVVDVHVDAEYNRAVGAGVASGMVGSAIERG